jgi:DNA-3-methyladenine glycosylase
MAQRVATGVFPVFLEEDATTVAKKLIGCFLVRDIGDFQIRAKIVETESYDRFDAASHSFNGRTARTDVMFGESGHLYVYFTYGMHYCCNVVTGKIGEGAAVLIRAVEPMTERNFVEYRRGRVGIEATNGPAKLCQALDIDKRLNGHNLRYFPLRLETGPPLPAKMIMSAERIGITKEKEALRRFYIRGNPYVSGL